MATFGTGSPSPMSEEFGMSGISGSKNQEEVRHPSGGRIPYGGLAYTLNDGTPPFSNDVYMWPCRGPDRAGSLNVGVWGGRGGLQQRWPDWVKRTCSGHDCALYANAGSRVHVDTEDTPVMFSMKSNQKGPNVAKINRGVCPPTSQTTLGNLLGGSA